MPSAPKTSQSYNPFTLENYQPYSVYSQMSIVFGFKQQNGKKRKPPHYVGFPVMLALGSLQIISLILAVVSFCCVAVPETWWNHWINHYFVLFICIITYQYL